MRNFIQVIINFLVELFTTAPEKIPVEPVPDNYIPFVLDSPETSDDEAADIIAEVEDDDENIDSPEVEVDSPEVEDDEPEVLDDDQVTTEADLLDIGGGTEIVD